MSPAGDGNARASHDPDRLDYHRDDEPCCGPRGVSSRAAIRAARISQCVLHPEPDDS